MAFFGQTFKLCDCESPSMDYGTHRSCSTKPCLLFWSSMGVELESAKPAETHVPLTHRLYNNVTEMSETESDHMKSVPYRKVLGSLVYLSKIVGYKNTAWNCNSHVHAMKVSRITVTSTLENSKAISEISHRNHIVWSTFTARKMEILCLKVSPTRIGYVKNRTVDQDPVIF